MENNFEDISKRLICRAAYYLECMKRTLHKQWKKQGTHMQKNTNVYYMSVCIEIYRHIRTDIHRVDTECSGTLPWVSVEWLNQANFPFFSSGKPAGVLPFTDKMVSVKYQEQDINREHAASDTQKKKTRNSAYTLHPLLSENFIMWIKSTKLKPKEVWNIITDHQRIILPCFLLFFISDFREREVVEFKFMDKILFPVISMAKLILFNCLTIWNWWD